MGIHGLFTLIKNSVQSNDIYNITKPGTNQSPNEILVDSNSFMRDLIEIISIKIAKEHNNDNLFFPSGEYDIFKNAITEFHTVFKNAGINLVWILDGPKVFNMFFKYNVIFVFYNRELIKLPVLGRREHGSKETKMTLNI